MPKILKPGNVVGRYTVLAEINRGMMALSYSASEPGGRKVFFKQYKSPTVTVDWYRRYIGYQKELRGRIEGSPSQGFCYKFLDSFEADQCFFQVFEFLDKSDSLDQVLEKAQKDPKAVAPGQWVLMAKVLMGAMAQLHKAGIVHADLKPDNIMMIYDASIGMKYRLRVIDMDFSLLEGKTAPWHDRTGYFGTAGYLSPEHLRGQVPRTASDVFTLGIMLYQLLGGVHPYAGDDEAANQKRIYAHAARPLVFRPGVEAELGNVADIRAALHECLNPVAERRPTAEAIQAVLNNRLRPSSPPPPPPPPPPVAGLTLVGPGGQSVRANVVLKVGRTLIGAFGDDHRFYDEVQFSVEPAGGGWFLVPATGVRNATLLNGKFVTTRVALKTGDVLAVGKEEAGKQKMPLEVRIG